MPPETSAAAYDTVDHARDPGVGVRGDMSGTVLSCTAQSWPSPGGRIVVLRVVGEIDPLTYPMLQTCLDAVLFGAGDEPTGRVVVDLAGVTFCNVGGFALLARTAAVATENQTGYALSGCSDHLERCWRILDTIHPYLAHSPIGRYVSTAAAITSNPR